MTVLLAPEKSYTLFSPEDPGRCLPVRWASVAQSVLGIELVFVQQSTSPEGVLPPVAALEVQVRGVRDQRPFERARVVTYPLEEAAALLEAAHRAVEAMGGAGMDVLLARGKRVWQVPAYDLRGEPLRASLQLVLVLAHLFGAPVLPPEGGSLFGLRGTRLRLEALDKQQAKGQ